MRTVDTVLETRTRDEIDAFDEDHKEALEDRAQRIASTFAVAQRMFDILSESRLTAEGRQTALQFLNTLHNRFGNQ